MCLSIPSKVTKIDEKANIATVDTFGVSREASLDLVSHENIGIGDFVLIHIGFVMNKIDHEDAMASIETYKEILRVMDEEEKQKTILDSDNCQNGA